MYIYEIYGKDRGGQTICLYVGQTADVDQRMKAHRVRYKDEIVDVKYKKVDRYDADNEEARRIVECNARDNKRLPSNDLYIDKAKLKALLNEVVSKVVNEIDPVRIVSCSDNSKVWFGNIDLEEIADLFFEKAEVNRELIKFTVEGK